MSEKPVTIDSIKSCDDDPDIVSNVPLFNPPLFRQRYTFFYDFLAKVDAKSIADVGASELAFFLYYKRLKNARRYYGVDIDPVVLKRNHNRCVPMPGEHLLTRRFDFDISVLCGDICTIDSRLCGLDAFVMIELLEHLEIDDVPRMTHAVFGHYLPKYVLMSTPNFDFNVVFDGLRSEASSNPHHTNRDDGRVPIDPRFRHWDHKFEMTRDEFAEYVANVVKDYPHYEVLEISGVGVARPAVFTEKEAYETAMKVGYCSQIAIFKLKTDGVTNPDCSKCASAEFTTVFETLLRGSQPITPSEAISQELRQYDMARRQFTEEGEEEEDGDEGCFAEFDWLFEAANGRLCERVNIFLDEPKKALFDSKEEMAQFFVDEGYDVDMTMKRVYYMERLGMNKAGSGSSDEEPPYVNEKQSAVDEVDTVMNEPSILSRDDVKGKPPPPEDPMALSVYDLLRDAKKANLLSERPVKTANGKVVDNGEYASLSNLLFQVQTRVDAGIVSDGAALLDYVCRNIYEHAELDESKKYLVYEGLFSELRSSTNTTTNGNQCVTNGNHSADVVPRVMFALDQTSNNFMDQVD